MAVYTNDLRLKEIATGDESGTWGTSTNTNLELIAEAFSFGTEAITTNADTHTTTLADGATDPGRSIFLKYTGTLDSTCTITIGPNTVSKLWFIENATSGSQSIIIKQGSGATVTIANGQVKAIYSDGAGSGGAMVDAFTDLSVPSLFVSGALDVTGAITSSAGATITVADNSDNLTLTSTDADANSGPNVKLYRNSSSPADNDFLGNIKFVGRNDNSEDVQYAEQEVYILDASDGTEDGLYNVNVMTAGSNLSYMQFKAGSGVVFNEDSNDIDFRVESDDNANMLFVDGGEDRVGVGTNSPSRTFHSLGASGISTVGKFEAGGTQVYIQLSNNGASDADSGYIGYDSSSNLTFFTDNTEAARITSGGLVGIGNSNPSDFFSTANNLVVGSGSGSEGITVFSANDSIGNLFFADGTSGTAEFSGYLEYSHADDSLRVGTGGSERMRITSAGNVGIGATSPSSSFRTSIYGDGSSIIGGIEFRNASAGGSTFTVGHASATSPSATLNVVGAGNLTFNTNDTEAMRITSGGLVGIGTDSPSSYFAGANNLVLAGTGDSGLTVASGTSGAGRIHFADGTSGNARFIGYMVYNHSNDSMQFATSGAEAMRISASGHLLIGCTALPSGGAGGAGFEVGQSSARTILQLGTTTTSQETVQRFYNPNGNVGEIKMSGSSTIYSTTSDYRLKENVVAMSGATDRLKQLKPLQFNFIADANTTLDGFLAHEVQDVVPEAITGTKDAVDADGNPEYQGIDQSKLVPLLVATIQELEARITALENN